jgi:hypothetical protein
MYVREGGVVLPAMHQTWETVLLLHQHPELSGKEYSTKTTRKARSKVIFG